MRSGMRAGDAPPPLWEYPYVWATDRYNCSVVTGFVAHVQLFGSWPDLTPLAPFYSSAVAFNNRLEQRAAAAGALNNSRSLLSRDTSDRRGNMGLVNATRVQVERTVRIARIWRFVAAPGIEVDPTTLLVTPATTSSPTDATSGAGRHAGIGRKARYSSDINPLVPRSTLQPDAPILHRIIAIL